MKLLKKPFSFLATLYAKIVSSPTLRVGEEPNLVLAEHMVLVEEKSKRPYLLVAPSGSHSVSKLYVEDFIVNKRMYQKQFSFNDYGHIMFCIGGLQSLELSNIYQIMTFEFESKIIEVRQKSTLQNEFWDIAETIATQKYLLLDKPSILKLGIFFQQNNNSANPEIIDKTIAANLKMVK